MMVEGKPIEIFCGTGGVGKTTLATSRALHLSLEGKKVLLITIDPAKRLKQVLKLDDEYGGLAQKVLHRSIFKNTDENGSFDALLMSPMTTLKRIASDSIEKDGDFNNPILQILSRPNGGMNEILAIVEVQHQIESKNYDVIVLDTPPGKHFIDFLQSSKKIKRFFDKSFVEIFRYLGKKTDNEPTKFLTKIFSKGIKKLLSYLEVVTGPHFVETFIDAVVILYRNKDSFLEALNFQESLKNKSFSNWFLVTSVDQDKLSEAGQFQGEAVQFMHGDSFLAINKSLLNDLESWEPQSRPLKKLKLSMHSRETKVLKYASHNFDKVLHFPEVLDTSPEEHVKELCRGWKKEVKQSSAQV